MFRRHLSQLHQPHGDTASKKLESFRDWKTSRFFGEALERQELPDTGGVKRRVVDEAAGRGLGDGSWIEKVGRGLRR